MFKDSGKKRLSRSILDMKFMQRSKEKARKELVDEEGRALFSHLMTEEMKSGIGNCVIEQSYMRCEDLIEGRLSFQGMNPELERLLELERMEKNNSKSNEVDITDEEMAAAYKSSLVKTMASKFNKYKVNKKEQKTKWEGEATDSEPPVKKKKKFLKPKDD